MTHNKQKKYVNMYFFIHFYMYINTAALLVTQL